ncbi:restriction endonuclease subunit M [bacterium]|nr:MAG: restriction endonuclease subunit M [bacterium]
MSVPKEVSRLIEKFNQHLESYRSGKYNEAQLRNEFLNPFFKVLGWDMDNAQGLAEAYKDVVHEDAIRIGGAVKAPDYCFRIGGTRKFFLEAKKPSVDIGQETSAAYQLRRYAWSAKLPLSILSDFEEFAVYDCRVKPKKTDAASTARVFLCRYQDYPEKWDWISSIFSKEAILKGSFDKYAEENKAKRGTAEVDDDFLSTIESWRSELAKNLALRNSRLSQRELNFAVQRIIDRIIFLRICEDRGIEPYGRLQGLTNGANIYPRLCEVFEDADAKYNSGLFNFQAEKGRHEPPDEITLGLELDDKLLRSLLRDLYYPESPYEFTVISSDILGQAYEQFLGKVIRLTEGHHAVVEDKPEVKKAGGVYYTPTYIVDYIVKQTVGKLIEGKTPKQASKLRILDPACGSGSFLINAYQFLLDWHRDWYLAHKPETWTKGRNPVLVQTTAGWKLTIAERKRILLDNIYGVDIDAQAVEVTKLSLLLKVLEGESEQTIQPYLRLFSQRALPDLGNNIKCGNSLIGPDFYKQIDTDSLNNVEILKINPFDWHKEFPIVFSSKNPGFDVIVGNPPYIRVRILRDFIPPQAINYLESQYKCATHVWDIYLLFFERAAQLAHVCGRLAFIVPIQTLHQPNCESLRSLIINNNWLDTVADLSRIDIFSGAIVKNCIIVCDKSAKAKKFIFTMKPNTPIELSSGAPIKWPYENIRSNPGLSLKLDLLSPKNELCKKIKESSFALGELCYVTFGLRSCAKRKGGGW